MQSEKFDRGEVISGQRSVIHQAFADRGSILISMPLPATADELDDGWQQLEAMLASLRELARVATSAEGFYTPLLQQILAPLGMRGGIVWQRLASGSVQAICQQRPDLIQLDDDRDSQRFHLAAVEIVARGGRSEAVEPRSMLHGVANPTACTLLFAPVEVDGHCEFVIECFTDEECSAEALSGVKSLLDAIAVQAADYERTQRIRELQTLAADAEAVQSVTLGVHARLGLQATALTIVHDALRVFRCERASLLCWDGRRARLLAMSGVDSFDRRSATVRALEKLAALAAPAGELRFPNDEEQPPQVEQSLAAYIDEAHAHWLRAMPLHRHVSGEHDRPLPNDVIGMLVLERFSGSETADTSRAGYVFVQHAALALDNALLAHRWLWFRWASSWVGEAKMRSSARVWRRWAIAALFLVMVVIGLWPVEFRIAASGRLRPQQRQDIFAPLAGIVATVHVREGQAVTTDTDLVTLRSPALELQISEVAGKRQTAEASLTSARALRLQVNATDADRARAGAQEEELKATLAGLAEQSAILEQQRMRLVVTSPQAGIISTRDVERRLIGRPVNTGDLLLNVANLQGPWQLELDLPEFRLQDVLRAQANAQNPLSVRYLLASAPNASHAAQIESISDAAQLSADQQPIVPVIAALEGKPPVDARPEATVYAQIDGGRRPLAFVWLHDVWEAVKIRWWQ
jgi:multidrug efflux pump subunit AcrA (membrane-fusion protein)